jgi:hypothetical protein
MQTDLQNDLSALNDRFSQMSTSEQYQQYMINRLSFRTLQCLEHNFWRFQRSFLSLLPAPDPPHSSVPLSHSILLRRRLRMTRPSGIWCQRGEIWSDVWSLGGAHLFACIWNSCIALACLILVMHELWLDFGWLVIICETLWIVMWLRTRTCG